MESIKKSAQLAGLLYLLIAIIGGFSIGYVPSVLVVAGDAEATSRQLLAHQDLLRLAIVADVFVFLLEILLTAILFKLFKPVHSSLSRIAAFARLSMSVIMGLNISNYLVPLLLLSGASYLTVFSAAELAAFSLLFLEIHQFGIYLWGFFFSLHLIALGYLIFKSSYYPKLIGGLMMIGSLGYLGESFYQLLLPDFSGLSFLTNFLLLVAVIGELSFSFWLLIKGINLARWQQAQTT